MNVVVSYVVFYSFVAVMGAVIVGFLFALTSPKCCVNS